MLNLPYIYWITLDRAKDRQTFMEEQFKEKKYLNQKIIGIDGKKDNLSNIVVLDEDFDFNVHKPTTIACLLSHLIAINNFLNSNLEYAIIMEDDCIFDLNILNQKYADLDFLDMIKLLNKHKNWNILQLCYFLHKRNNKQILKVDNLFHKWINYLSTCAYLINKAGAKKLINLFYKNNKFNLCGLKKYDADHVIYSNVKTLTLKIPLFFYKQNMESLISNCHQDLCEKSYTLMQDILKKFIITVYLKENTNEILKKLNTLYGYIFIETKQLIEADIILKDNKIKHIINIIKNINDKKKLKV